MCCHSKPSLFQAEPVPSACTCNPRSQKPSTLNRRNFLRLSGMSGVTLLTAGSLAACDNVADNSPISNQTTGTGGPEGDAAKYVEGDAAKYVEGDAAKYVIEKAQSGGSGQTGPGPTIGISPFELAPTNLNNWLNLHPNVREAIVWQDEFNVLKYTQWPQSLKNRLQKIFEASWIPNPILSERYSLPENIMNHISNDFSESVLTKTDTLTNYLDYLAYSLRAELAQEVKWSMTTYSPALLANLLDSRTLYQWVTGPSSTFGATLPPGYSGGYYVKWTDLPTHPLISLQFLKDNNLIGATTFDTIARLVYWCGTNMYHYGLTSNTINLSSGELNYNIWHYRGSPPISKIIEGTKPDDPILWFAHWTMGCWGTVSFIKMVLQVLNIPVEKIEMIGHCLPYFPTDGYYLSHGDDPYAIFKNRPEFKGADLLINQSAYNSHFGPGVSDANKQKNVGYRAMELLNVIKLPPLPQPLPVSTTSK